MRYCDGCGISVTAKWVATKGEQMLQFCNHHKNEHEPKLTPQGWKLINIEGKQLL